MKKLILFFVVLFVFCHPSNAQNDTMYIMKNGVTIGKYNVNSQVDSVIFYKPQPPNSGTFTDSRDGNVYKWVKIGNQIWMAENLKYLPSVVGHETGSKTTPCYYVYGYNGTSLTTAKTVSNYITYGVLYNWRAACSSCPLGWHLPSDAEWIQLTNYLGGESIAGGKLKETGITHWLSPNTGATNQTGFTALPSGRRDIDGFWGILNHSSWWSYTQDSSTSSWYYFMHYDYNNLYRHNNPNELGFSVRCLKD